MTKATYKGNTQNIERRLVAQLHTGAAGDAGRPHSIETLDAPSLAPASNEQQDFPRDLRALKKRLADEIERLIAVYDQIEPDVDLEADDPPEDEGDMEPSLGSVNPTLRPGEEESQIGWSRGGTDDLEHEWEGCEPAEYRPVLPRRPKLSDRELIDEAVAAGKVRRVPMGASGMDPHTGQPVAIVEKFAKMRLARRRRYDWTDERDSTLLALYADGKIYRDIAAAMGIAVSAVVCRIRTLELAGRVRRNRRYLASHRSSAM